MMSLIFSRLITNCPHEQQPQRPGQMRMRHTQQDNKRRRGGRRARRGAEEEGKHFGRGPKYLTLQMKWQNVESNAQTAQNVRQSREGEWNEGVQAAGRGGS